MIILSYILLSYMYYYIYDYQINYYLSNNKQPHLLHISPTKIPRMLFFQKYKKLKWIETPIETKLFYIYCFYTL